MDPRNVDRRRRRRRRRRQRSARPFHPAGRNPPKPDRPEASR